MSDDIFLKRIQDICRLCEKYHTPRFSGFLDEREQAVINQSGILSGINSAFFGGYPDAERKILGVFPEWEEPSQFPVSALEIVKKYDKEISHRNYLGTVLSLGIERSKTGDILAGEKGAYIFVSEDIADFIKNNICKVAGCGVEIHDVSLTDITIPPRRFEIIETVAASARLDAVLAAVLKKSRSEIKSLIASGRVSVNHFEKTDADCTLKEQDLLSVRGFGRVQFESIGCRTRSDRIHITLKKYI